MKHPRRSALIVILIFASAFIEPAPLAYFLDSVRYFAATVVTWPIRQFERPPRSAEKNFDAASARRAWQRFQESGSAVGRPVFGTLILAIFPERDVWVVAAGRSSGVERGCAVSIGGALAGFVDRTEENTSRVKLLSNTGCPFAATVVPRVPSASGLQILLRGSGAGFAETQRGSVLAESHIGEKVVTFGAPGVPGGLDVGKVEFSQRLGTPAVRLAFADVADDEVEVWDKNGSGRLPIQTEALFEPIATEVTTAFDSSGTTPSFQIDVGGHDGVVVNAPVGNVDRLIGFVERVGWAASRVRPLATARTGVDAVRVVLAPDGTLAEAKSTHWPDDGPADAFYFARGRPFRAPRGAFFGRGADRDRQAADFRKIAPGEHVTVFVFRRADELKLLSP